MLFNFLTNDECMEECDSFYMDDVDLVKLVDVYTDEVNGSVIQEATFELGEKQYIISLSKYNVNIQYDFTDLARFADYIKELEISDINVLFDNIVDIIEEFNSNYVY